MNREGFYKSLALCALGQQGKGVEEKTLMGLGDVGEWLVLCSRQGLLHCGLVFGTLPISPPNWLWEEEPGEGER